MSFSRWILIAAIAVAQSAAAHAPSFEVASIKVSKADPRSGSGVTTEIGRIHAQNTTLRRFLEAAYDLPQTRILGGPAWLDQMRYEIVAKAETPAVDEELMLMMQTLVAERFHLVVHRESRILHGYALMVDKTGPKMKPSDPGTAARTTAGRGLIDAKSSGMPHLAMKLAAALHEPVSDLTQLPGAFDFTLKWTPDDMRADAAADSMPSLFTALQEQLGLKLESRKVSMEVLVVDQAELPTEN